MENEMGLVFMVHIEILYVLHKLYAEQVKGW